MADRITQIPVEAIIEPDSSKVRVTQIPVEAIIEPNTQKARVSQIAVEVLKDNISGSTFIPAPQVIIIG